MVFSKDVSLLFILAFRISLDTAAAAAVDGEELEEEEEAKILDRVNDLILFLAC
jgi:hypothetical protein